MGKKPIKGQDNLNRSGRPKGAKNRFTNLKESFIQSFKEVGGTSELTAWAKDNKKEFYKMVSTMLPKNVEMKSANELIITIESAIPEPKPRPKRESKP